MEPISGDMTTAQARKMNRAADIAERLNLPIARVKARLDSAPGNTLIRTVFEKEWDNDAVGFIGARTAARARDDRFIGMVAFTLSINAHEVQKRTSGATGNTRLDTLFSAEWPSDHSRHLANRRARDYVGNQPLRWIRGMELLDLVEIITGFKKRQIRSIVNSHGDDSKTKDAFAPWPGAPPLPADLPSPEASAKHPVSVTTTRLVTPNLQSNPSMPSAISFPQPIIDAYRGNHLAILFGSGLSLASDVIGGFPRWDELMERFLDQIERAGVWTPNQIKARRAALTSGYLPLEGMLAELDVLKTALRGVRKYRAALTSIFRPSNAKPGDVHRALVEVGANVLLTSNYDELLEIVEGPPTRRVYTWQKADKALEDVQEGLKVLFKIHGTADDDDSVVMTRAEYDKAATNAAYRQTMSYLLQTHTFLLVGYGINDPLDLDIVFSFNDRVFGTAARPHYALMKNPQPSDRDRWQREMNVQTLPYSRHEDLPMILRALRGTRTP